MITKLTPNLIVPDVDVAAAFYERIGFARVYQFPEEGAAGFAILSADGVELMLQSQAGLAEDLPPVAAQAVGGGAILYLEVDDVQGLHDRIAADVDVVVAMRETFYGSTEFFVRDPNGYVVGFAQPQS